VSSPVLCVDIGGTSTKAAILDIDGRLGAIKSIPTRPDTESFLETMVELIEITRADAGVEVKQMGIAMAGFVDAARNSLVYNSNLMWLHGFPLRTRLEERFPEFAIELEVDSNASTMAEYHFGSGQGSRRFLCLTVGTGLGVGMTVDGVPLRFAYGCMGDIGHTVVLRDGPLCTCGGRGCAEALVSSTTIARDYQTQTHAAGDITLRDVIEAAHAGDAQATSLLAGAGEWLGVAAATLAHAFFPDHIAIAGGLSAAGDIVLAPAERVFRETASVFAREKATFCRASLGSTATLLGASWPFWGK